MTTLAELIADQHRLALVLIAETAADQADYDRAFADLIAAEERVAAAPVQTIHDLALKILEALADDATYAMQAAVIADARRILGQTTH